MSARCRHCLCPLTKLKSERRFVCARCTEARFKEDGAKYREKAKEKEKERHRARYLRLKAKDAAKWARIEPILKGETYE